MDSLSTQPGMPPRHVPKADLRLQTLRQNVLNPGIYEDFIIVAPKRPMGDPEGGEAPSYADIPQLPKELEHLSLSNVPGIPLPSGEWLFYCRVSQPDLVVFLENPDLQERYIADSWLDLFHSDYEHWDLVFGAETQRISMSGKFEHWRGTFAELQPGDAEIRPYVPAVFSGDNLPELVLSTEQRERFIPNIVVDEDVVTDPPSNELIYFFVDGFGVDLGKSGAVELEDGIHWWPAAAFPSAPFIFQHLSDPFDPYFSHGTFTGVLTVPFPDVPLDDNERLEFVTVARTRVRRLRTLLHVLYEVRLDLIAEFFFYEYEGSSGSLHRELYGNRYYRYPLVQHGPIRRTRYHSDVLRAATELAFATPKGKALAKFIHRSLDSLDLARSLSDLPVSHVLTWAAIESIISPTDHSELIANMTLCLMGLQSPHVDRARFWDAAKRSYKIRSTIVHSFDFPDPEQLTEAFGFAEEQLTAVLRYAVLEGIRLNLSKDTLTSNLRGRGLAGHISPTWE